MANHTPGPSAASVRVALRCPPSPVVRAKEDFFQLVREKKREFEARLDYEFLWLRELREEVERATHHGPLLPATPTAVHKRQRVLLEAREAIHCPAAPMSPVFSKDFSSLASAKRTAKHPELGTDRRKQIHSGRAPSPTARMKPFVLSASRLGTTPRGRREGSIIKSLFSEAPKSVTTSIVDKNSQEKENHSTSSSASPCGSDTLFLPPPNAWLRTPSPVKKVDGKGVIAVRVRKTPLSLAQQNLRNRARELGLDISSSPSTIGSASENGALPRQELLLTEDDTAVVFRIEPVDEASPGVTADWDVGTLTICRLIGTL